MHHLYVSMLVVCLLGFALHGASWAKYKPDPAILSLQQELLEDPIAAAEKALDRQDFRFVSLNSVWNLARPGIQCFLHIKREAAFDPVILIGDVFIIRIGDEPNVGPGSEIWASKLRDAARLYNQHIARDGRYPDPDICWPDETDDIPYSPERDYFLEVLGKENGEGPAHQELERFRVWKGDADNKAQQASLVQAARHGHVEAAKAFLRAGESPNQADEWGLTALDWAIARNNEPLVSLLLNNGAKPYQNRFSDDWLKREIEFSYRRFAMHEIRWAILAENSAILRMILTTMFNEEEKCTYSYMATESMELAVRANQPVSLEVLTDWYGELGLRDCERHNSGMGWVFDTAEKLGRTELAEWLKKHYGEN